MIAEKLGAVKYSDYQDDPVRFGEDVLGHDYPPDIKKVLRSVRDNQITIVQSCTGYGKTFSAADIAIWVYKCFNHAKVFTAAAPPIDNLEKLLWGEIGSIVNANPSLFSTDVIGYLNISKPVNVKGTEPSQYVAGVTIPSSGTAAVREAKFSGKHAPVLVAILDEIDAIPDEVFTGIDGWFSGGEFVRLVGMFNPRAKTGEAYRMIRDGRANVVVLSAFTHPNVITGKDIYPGAVTRNKTVLRINRWTRPLAKDETADPEATFDLPDYLDGVTAVDEKGQNTLPLSPGKYKIEIPEFSYKVLGRYPAQGSNQLISTEWINMARSRWNLHISKWGEKPPEGTTGVGGLDCAAEGEHKNVLWDRWGGYISKCETWGKVDMYVTGDKASAFYHQKKLSSINIDAGGVGAGVAPHMRRLGCNAHGFQMKEKPSKTSELGSFDSLRDQLCWALREWLRIDPGAMLPPDEELIEELGIPTYYVDNGKIKVMPFAKPNQTHEMTVEKALGRHPDKMPALIMCFAESPAIKPTTGSPVIHKSGYAY